jgi:hypothetical protein
MGSARSPGSIWLGGIADEPYSKVVNDVAQANLEHTGNSQEGIHRNRLHPAFQRADMTGMQAGLLRQLLLAESCLPAVSADGLTQHPAMFLNGGHNRIQGMTSAVNSTESIDSFSAICSCVGREAGSTNIALGAMGMSEGLLSMERGFPNKAAGQGAWYFHVHPVLRLDLAGSCIGSRIALRCQQADCVRLAVLQTWDHLHFVERRGMSRPC